MRHLIFLIILFYLTSFGQADDYEVNGYAKYLFSSSRLAGDENRLNDHLLHARLNTRWSPTFSFYSVLETRLRGYYGDSVSEVPGFKDLIKNKYDLLDLDAVLLDKSDSYIYAEIDRLYFDYTTGKLEMTIGRQRIAWGTSLVWNITDLFNPKSVLDFDYEEMPGADALRLQYYTGAVSKAEFVIKPGENRYTRTIAGLWSINTAGYDIFFIGGLKNNRKIAGFSWAGDIRGAGFRGEITFSDPPKKGTPAEFMIPDLYGSSITEENRNSLSVVLSGDYTFENSFYIHTEMLYNNVGKTKNTGLFSYQAGDAGLLSPARWSVYHEFSYNITPLTRGTVFLIYNPSDRSSITVPLISHSLTESVDLMLIGFLSSGKRFTEYGDAGDSFFLRMRYSF